ALGRALDGPARQHERALADLGQAGDAAQERRLAAAARADDAEDFLVADGEIELAEGDDGAVEEELARVLRDDRAVRDGSLARRRPGIHGDALLPAGLAARPDLAPDLRGKFLPAGGGVKRLAPACRGRRCPGALDGGGEPVVAVAARRLVADAGEPHIDATGTAMGTSRGVEL